MAGNESNRSELTTLTFVVQKPDNTHSTPRWREAEVQNASCPRCGKIMVVMVGDNMYGYCPKCECYFIAD